MPYADSRYFKHWLFFCLCYLTINFKLNIGGLSSKLEDFFHSVYRPWDLFFLFAAFPYISKTHLCFNKDHQENVLQPVRKERAKLLNLQEKD
jgi:hypothetical protein